MRKSHWWVPLTGALFVIVAIIGAIVQGEPPGADDPVQEIVSHYDDNKTRIQIGSLVITIAAAVFVFFAGYMRKRLDAVAGGRSMLPTVALVGAGIFAVGAAIDSMIAFALSEAVGDIEPSAVQALQALWDNDFMPIVLGLSLFFLATGLAAVRYGSLPKWLAWIAVLLGVVALTPVGFVAFLAGAVWILGVGILLALRERKAGAGPPRDSPGGTGPGPDDPVDRNEPPVTTPA